MNNLFLKGKLIRYSGDSSRQEGELEAGQKTLAGAVPSNISHVQWMIEAVLIVIQYCLDIYHVGLVFNRNKISHMIPDLCFTSQIGDLVLGL